MKTKLSVSILVFALFLLLPGCSSKKGPLVAKVKGFKIYQSELDSINPEIRDKERRTERLQQYIKGMIDDQVLYLKARKLKYDRQPENKAVLSNIEMIEAANYYNTEIIQKNWGFPSKEIVAAYNADKELYKKEKPAALATPPTPDQKKALDDYKADPYKPLDQVRTKVLRKMLLAKAENKKILDDLISTMKKDSLDSAKIKRTEDEIVNTHTGGLEEKIFEQLKKDHKVELIPYVPKITDEEIKDEWEKTKTTYKRKPDYQVQHIEVANEKAARDIIEKVNTKNKDFAGLQKKYSVNKATIGKTITVVSAGEIKDLVGLTNTQEIYNQILYVPVGKVSNPVSLKTTDGKGMFNVFKIVSVEPEAIQTFEESKQAVRTALWAKKQLVVPPNTILAKIDGKPLTIEDINTLLYKMSPMVIERFKTEEGRKTLLEKYYLRFRLYSELVKAQGLFDDPVLKARILKNQKGFLVSDFKQNYFEAYSGLSESEVLKYYKNNPDTFMGPDKKPKLFAQVKDDVIKRVLVSPKTIEAYYNFNMEDYADNDGEPKPLKDVYGLLNNTLLSKERETHLEGALQQFRREFGFKVYRKELDFNKVKTPDAVFEESKKLHEERKYADAIKGYLDLRYRTPNFKAHPDICMALAQIYIEQNQYYKAIQEYKRFLRLYPDSKDRYKAQFMIGFVYSENLKDKGKAVTSYQSVLDNYPGCDLIESAKFMIEHLKSGKDDFAFMQDSTGVIDSATAAAEAKIEATEKEEAMKAIKKK